MTIEEIERQQKELQEKINYEENLDCRNDREAIRVWWNEWHRLEKIRKFLKNNDKEIQV